MRKLRVGLRRRWRRLRLTALPIAQCAIAAGIAWFIAAKLIGHARPFFAPIAAVICLGVSLGQRPRRVVELVAGVSIGIGVGDVLISLIGSGTWQIALVVVLAMGTAVLLDGGTIIAMQAGSSAVLVATLLPPGDSGGLDRMVDALVGGSVGLIVAALLPANPLTVAHRQGGAVLSELAAAFRGVAAAISSQDPTKAAVVLTQLRKTNQLVEEFRSALNTGMEIAKIAPMRWRRRTDLERYLATAVPLDHALRNSRVLVRRASAALRADEPIPSVLPTMLLGLAGAVDQLKADLAAGKPPRRARKTVREVVQAATTELANEGGFSFQVVIAQLRSIAVDLLQATGLNRDDAVAALPPLVPPVSHSGDEEDRAEPGEKPDGPQRS